MKQTTPIRQIHGWGRYPRMESHISRPQSMVDCLHVINQQKQLITRGMGRSYGDSSLAANVLDTQYLNCFYDFDETTGVLSCESGVSLAEILDVFVPRGWFLPVTPGTRFISLGGAIASDVHGKNHHIEGTFTDHVIQVELILGNGQCISASPTQNPELFHATCGGMGLTGIIFSATIRLKPIHSSQIIESIIKLPSLSAVLAAFDEHEQMPYSVAWIDCLATGKNAGRSLLRLGEHAENGCLSVPTNKALSIPLTMPACLLNKTTLKCFNTLYYQMARKAQYTHEIHYESFFYPLDKLAHWNRLYGKPGFIQYQFVLPKEAGEEGLSRILDVIAQSGKGSFLAVLKKLGKQNNNYLSFPMIGYTLALDFNVEPSIFPLLNTLDQLVLTFGGRHYLCKDSRLDERTFKASYAGWQAFENVRQKYYAVGKFASQQSKRIGLK